MAYPVQISSTGNHSIGYGVTGEPTVDVSYGPYRRNDDLYCFIVEELAVDEAEAHVFKSTDEGLTWAKQDATGAPTLRAGDAGLVDAVALSCVPFYDLSIISEIYCLFIDTAGDLRVGRFDLSTDSWGTLSASGPSDYEPTRDDRFAMGARAVGVNGIEFPIAYSGPKDTVSATDYKRVWYTVYRKASNDWLTPVRLFGGVSEAVHYDVAGVTYKVDPGVGVGRNHFFATAGSGFTGPLWHRSVETSDTLNTINQVSTKSSSPGRPIFESSELLIPILDNADFNLYAARATQAAIPVWSEELVGDMSDALKLDFWGAVRIPGNPDTVRIYYENAPGPAFNIGLFYREWTTTTEAWGAETAVHVGDPPIDDDIWEISTEWHQAVDGTTYFGVLFNMGASGLRPARYTQQEGPPVAAGPELMNGIFDIPEGGYVIS